MQLLKLFYFLAFLHRDRVKILIQIVQLLLRKWLLLYAFANFCHKIGFTCLLRQNFELILDKFEVFSIHELLLKNFQEHRHFNSREVINNLLALSIFSLIECAALNNIIVIDIDIEYVLALKFLHRVLVSVDHELLIKLFLHAVGINQSLQQRRLYHGKLLHGSCHTHATLFFFIIDKEIVKG